MAFYAAPTQAKKPANLEPVVLTFVGVADMTADSSEVIGEAPDFDAKRSAKRGQVQVEIVVRGMLLSVPVAFALDGGNICFIDGDAPAAGALTLFDGGLASFDLYAEFRTVGGDMQSYNFFLEGTHDILDLSAPNPVVGTVTFNTMDVDTEGRGKRPKSCRGTLILDDTALEITAE